MKKTWDEEKQETLEQLDFETEHADLDDDEYFQAKRSWLVQKDVWKHLLSDISASIFLDFKLAELHDHPYTLAVNALDHPFQIIYTKEHELLACFEKDNKNWDSVIIVDSFTTIKFKTSKSIEITESNITKDIDTSEFYNEYIKKPLELWLKSIKGKEINFCHSGKDTTWFEFKDKV